jgi:hypothetical protein
LGVKSRLKFTDCFALHPVAKHLSPELNLVTPNPDLDKDIKNKRLFAYSIYGNLHCMDFKTFEWSIISENSAENVN